MKCYLTLNNQPKNTMNREDCKPGTKVLIQGVIREDDNTAYLPIIVRVQNGAAGCGCAVGFSPDQLEEVKYSPDRRFRKGDKVRLIDRGRKAPVTLEYGKIYTVDDNEAGGGVCVNNIMVCYAILELVEGFDESFNIPFHEAVRMMVEGSTMERISADSFEEPIQFRIVNSMPQCLVEDEAGSTVWLQSAFGENDIKSMWRKVEKNI